jgi:NADH:ubiquinone oxidoreductase subunit 4 (subunit M)
MASFIVYKFIYFYILFELRLIPILLLIIFAGNQPERLGAGTIFLIYTLTLSLPYLLILVYILPWQNINSDKLIINTGVFSLLLLIPFLVKIPILGLHY